LFGITRPSLAIQRLVRICLTAPGYALSQKRRKKIEEPFGWAKTVGPMAQTMLRGVKRVGAQFAFTMAACNLARLPKLLAV
jgi:hypothetical protein